MRVYKLLNHYIDLDHVLMVSELKKVYKDVYPDQANVQVLPELWFEVTLAFQDKPKLFAYWMWSVDTLEVRNGKEENFKNAHANFLDAWKYKDQPKPTVTVTEITTSYERKK